MRSSLETVDVLENQKNGVKAAWNGSAKWENTYSEPDFSKACCFILFSAAANANGLISSLLAACLAYLARV